jgi:hypothetical protein
MGSTRARDFVSAADSDANPHVDSLKVDTTEAGEHLILRLESDGSETVPRKLAIYGNY